MDKFEKLKMEFALLKYGMKIDAKEQDWAAIDDILSKMKNLVWRIRNDEANRERLVSN